jgi:RNA polymerase sigma-70 factor (ECF subfamily)
VLAAGDSSAPATRDALETLCRTYWYPLYAFACRKGYNETDAQDVIQEFFQRLLEKKYLQLADRKRGKFRTFLLSSLQHFLVNEWTRARAAKRGSGRPMVSWDSATAEGLYECDATTDLTPEKIYEQRWAVTLLERVLTRLQQEVIADGKGEAFEQMKIFLWGEAKTGSYGDLARNLGLTENAARVAVHRLRQRYRQLLRAEIAHTVAHPDDIDDEIRYLFRALS